MDISLHVAEQPTEREGFPHAIPGAPNLDGCQQT
jgi:hypothetical protein